MIIKDKRIDSGKGFDWGRASEDYAKYRDIYPAEFFDKIYSRGLCVSGQSVLDVGTGTGVLPRSMYSRNARWTGTDISEEQIQQARALSKGMNIDYYVMSAENLTFADNSFNVITACQCFMYFNHTKAMPKFYSLLKPEGRILILYMAWLPAQDKIAGESERLVLKYNPRWSGAGEALRPVSVPDCYNEKFKLAHSEEFLLKVHFTRESWNGRMKACRGIGASLTQEEIINWEHEHMKMLCEKAPAEFDILHYGAIAELKRL